MLNMSRVLFYCLIGVFFILGETLEENYIEIIPTEVEESQMKILLDEKIDLEEEENATWNNYDYVDVTEEELTKIRSSEGTILNDENGCPENEEVTACIRLCESCNDIDRACITLCTSNEEGRCYCKGGFYRHNVTGKCVSPEQCTNDLLLPRCPQNEFFSSCGSCYEAEVCEGFIKDYACTLECRQQCVCLEGFRRHPRTGACIPEAQCPKPPQCGLNENIPTCVPCDQNCEDFFQEKVCIKRCFLNKGNCYCSPGFYRHPESGECVEPSQCYQQEELNGRCRGGKNELWYDCGPCETSQECKYFWSPIACTEQCRPAGCYCAPGFYRHPVTRNCVPASCCPPRRDPCYGTGRPRVPRCRGKHENYWDQKLVCEELTCGGYSPRPVYRPPRCKPKLRSGCFCSRGYYRDPRRNSCISCGRHDAINEV